MGKAIINGHSFFNGLGNAESVEYDNSSSKMKSTNIQSAIDELRAMTNFSVSLTQDQYDKLGSEKLTNGITYYITDGDGSGRQPDASNIVYDPVVTELPATSVQLAIDATNKRIDDLIKSLKAAGVSI